MSIARRRRRAADKHFNVLSELLMDFYRFLEKTPKPANDEVRAEFKSRNGKWRHYCITNKLNDVASELFTKEVAASWRKRYTADSPKTGK